MRVAPSITWLFVSTSPSELTTTPVPAPATPWNDEVTLMSTSAGATFAASADSLAGPPELDALPLPP